MSGQKKELASEATAKLASVFDQQLRVPTLISAFSSQGHNCTIGVIKDFQAKDSNRAIHAKFDYFDAWTSGNADGDALLWMHEKLQARKEQRKIMIVLSDGAPTDGHQGSSPDDMLRAVAQAIEKSPDFTLIGIGIDSTQVKRYYKNYKVVHKVTELDKELLKILKETYTHDD
jgi:nitric oxide reductase activation protein